MFFEENSLAEAQRPQRKCSFQIPKGWRSCCHLRERVGSRFELRRESPRMERQRTRENTSRAAARARRGVDNRTGGGGAPASGSPRLIAAIFGASAKSGAPPAALPARSAAVPGSASEPGCPLYAPPRLSCPAAAPITVSRPRRTARRRSSRREGPRGSHRDRRTWPRRPRDTPDNSP
jgi:hypothetical protein